MTCTLEILKQMFVSLKLHLTGYLVFGSSAILLICWLFFNSLKVLKMAPTKKFSSFKMYLSVACDGLLWLSRKCKRLSVDKQALVKSPFYDSCCRSDGVQTKLLSCESYHSSYTDLLSIPIFLFVKFYSVNFCSLFKI